MPILGIDEVGRGPWAGPLVVGAVILRGMPKSGENQVAASTGENTQASPGDAKSSRKVATSAGGNTRIDSGAKHLPGAENYPDWVQNLTDSKKLSEKKRQLYAEKIWAEAPAAALGWVAAAELDALGLAEALRLAARRAVREIMTQNVTFTEIIIDGTVNLLSGTSLESSVTTLKKADLLVKEVSAASIIAKVARDNYMRQLAREQPGYHFDKHVGYGTAAHRAALLELGPTAEHRLSFRPVAEVAEKFPEVTAKLQQGRIKKQPDPTKKVTTKALGDRAEKVVADFLESEGHTILARNWRTPYYEIDIISAQGQELYFTEVKYRRTSHQGGAWAAVDSAKHRRMRLAAESFMHYLREAGSEYADWQPILTVAGMEGVDFHLLDVIKLID